MAARSWRLRISQLRRGSFLILGPCSSALLLPCNHDTRKLDILVLIVACSMNRKCCASQIQAAALPARELVMFLSKKCLPCSRKENIVVTTQNVSCSVCKCVHESQIEPRCGWMPLGESGLLYLKL